MRVRVAALGVAVLVAATASLGVSSVAHADEVRDGQWYLDTFDIDKVHELSQGAGVTIGVIDSGIDPNHPDLEGNIKPGKDFTKESDDGLTDKVGHGTAVASVLAGHGHGDNGVDGIMGIAPEATVISARVDNGKGEQFHQLASDALQWLVDQDVDIISVSLGVVPTNEAFDTIVQASEKGIPIVASAGNRTDEPNAEEFTHWPAKADGAIPVTGTTQQGSFWEDSLTLKDASTQPQLGISAPGVDIPIALPGGKYDTVDGTSFSAPIVAGTLALIKSAYPKLDLFQWNNRLLDTVDDKGDKGFDDKYGWGIVNPLKALTEETTYNGPGGAQVSSPDDILPLDEQGKDTGDTKPSSTASPNEDPKSSSDSDQAFAGQDDNGIPTWTIITAAAAILLISAIITLVVIRRRKKSNTQAPNVVSQPTNAAPPAGYPPHQPGPNPHLTPPQQPTPPTNPPQ